MIPALAGVVVLLGGVVFLLWRGGVFGSSAGPVVPATTASSAGIEPEGASESPAATAEPEEQVTVPSSVKVICWTGELAIDLDACARPSTDAEAFEYLEYVYPAVAELIDSCELTPTPEKYSDVAASMNCPVDGVSNVRFRYWRDLDDAIGHYSEDETKYDADHAYDVYIGDQLVYGWVRTYSVPNDGLLTLTMFLPDHHLSLSIEGKSTKVLWAEFERTRIRPVEEMLGYTSADGPSVALLGRG